MSASRLSIPKPIASAISWIACWNTVVMKSRSQCRPQPAVCGRIQSPSAAGASAMQQVDERQPHDQLQQHVEDEEAVDEVEQGEEEGHAHAPHLDGGEQGLRG